MTERSRILRNAEALDSRTLPVHRGTASAGLSSEPAARDNRPMMDRETLKELFADELATLRETELQAARAVGHEQAQAELDKQRKLLVAEFEVLHDKLAAENGKQEKNLQRAVHSLKAAVEEVQAHRDALLHDLEPALVEIVLAGVLKIIGHAARDGTLVRRLVAKQLHDVLETRPLRVRLAGEDLALLTAATEDMEAFPRELFVADDTLTPGDYLIDTENGTLDAGLDLQLARFRDLLSKTYRMRGN